MPIGEHIDSKMKNNLRDKRIRPRRQPVMAGEELLRANCAYRQNACLIEDAAEVGQQAARSQRGNLPGVEIYF
jgi:hypothetical protein